MPEPRQLETDRSAASSPPTGGLDRRLAASQRLRRSALFAETFAQNRKWVGPGMVLWTRRGGALRLGVVSSKKVGLRANRRNRARRLLREAFRRLRPYFSGDVDVVLVARRALLSADWKEILREMLALAVRAGLATRESAAKAEEEHGLGADPEAPR